MVTSGHAVTRSQSHGVTLRKRTAEIIKMATPGFPSTNVNSFIKINGAQSQANKEILTAADGNFCTEKNKRTVCHWLKMILEA